MQWIKGYPEFRHRTVISIRNLGGHYYTVGNYDMYEAVDDFMATCECGGHTVPSILTVEKRVNAKLINFDRFDVVGSGEQYGLLEQT